MAYSIKPHTRCHVCKHSQLTYQREPSRYSGPWRKFRTTRSLHFGKPVLCVGKTYYFVDGAWMMRLKILKICSEHNAHDGVARLPDVQSSASRNFQPKQRWRRDSEKLLSAEDDRLAPN